MKEYYSKFEPHQFYHIYNRSNGSEKLFREPKNYSFFLKRWQEYLSELIDVWAYCLMGNHFHFLIKVGDEKRLAQFRKPGKSDTEIISNRFRSLFISYTKSFNKAYDRHGSLFQKPFKHVLVDSQSYLLTLIHYIHHNFTENFTDWKYSSYHAITSDGKTAVKRSEVLTLFGGRKEFFDFHEQLKSYKQIGHLIIE